MRQDEQNSKGRGSQADPDLGQKHPIMSEMLQAATSQWRSQFREGMTRRFSRVRGGRLADCYEHAFALHFQQVNAPIEAVNDVEVIEEGMAFGAEAARIYKADDNGQIWLKLYFATSTITLSELLPLIENLGAKVISEFPYLVTPKPVLPAISILDFRLSVDSKLRDSTIRHAFEEALLRIRKGDAENDRFNRLILSAGLDWREVILVRAYSRYLKQIGSAFSGDYMADALTNNPGVTKELIALFHSRLDPARSENDDESRDRLAAIDGLLELVDHPEEERVLRRFLNVIQATVRTNYYCTDSQGQPRPYLSLKLNSAQVDGMPKPKPWREAFVYSPKMEAVHLRGGPIARGGIRWSDRREDFRTEVLGLVKAQLVKNALIIPAGAKGGFIVKAENPDIGLVKECYQTMMRGLLDITDNRIEERVVETPSVRRRDGEDSYLVVAADKGTATFSDLANAVSQEYGFWLGDAFASGGSKGYDHKAMGITARGAWESVKRHFREQGMDCQQQAFTAVGVGDMAGDVFGNGMLQSKQTLLLGAFNHEHIFLDPDPDAAMAWQERKRLFGLKRSSWADYRPSALSAGGAIYSRRAKWINVTPQIRKMLGLKDERVTPNELIKALLTMQVDLLWFGGIGTYIKGASEGHDLVGDHANDAIRVLPTAVQAKVIGEGANLAVTQQGRIELALQGVRINTDTIDNAGGVNCSDREVNIKILLKALRDNGQISSRERDRLLVDMTDEVAELVLKDNREQAQAISAYITRGAGALAEQSRFMEFLERQGVLDRGLENLPNRDVLEDRLRHQAGLTRPEVAVLMAYSKNWLMSELLNSTLVDDDQFEEELLRYFPRPLGDRYPQALMSHLLRREIIANRITNEIVNRFGGVLIVLMMEHTGVTSVDVVRAYYNLQKILDLRTLWEQVDRLEGQEAQEHHLALLQTTIQGVSWLLKNRNELEDVTSIRRFMHGCYETYALMTQQLDGPYRELRAARSIRQMLDTTLVAEACNVNPAEAEQVYKLVLQTLDLEMGDFFQAGLGQSMHMEQWALTTLVDDIEVNVRHLCALIVRHAVMTHSPWEEAVEFWRSARIREVNRLPEIFSHIRSRAISPLAPLVVAEKTIRNMVMKGFGASLPRASA